MSLAVARDRIRPETPISGQVSQIDHDVVNRLRAANQKVAVSGLVEWLRSVGDGPRNQTALTVVANTRPARPADRNIARLGQLQNARVGRLPMCGDAAARERYQRTRCWRRPGL